MLSIAHFDIFCAWQVIKCLLVSLCGSGMELGEPEAQACRALLALAAAALDSRYMHVHLDMILHSGTKSCRDRI